MNTLPEALQEYLALRRGLGYKMHDAGHLLPRFVSFLEERQASHITTRLALEWTQQATTVQPAERARRLCFVRGFARVDLLPYRSTRARAHLYTEQEVQRLLDAALNLPTPRRTSTLRPWVFHCLLGLLSLTGLRISEALDLKLGDVDLNQGVLPIRAAKLGRSRLVPLHPSTCAVLADYLQRREQSWAAAAAVTSSSPPVVRAWTSAAFTERSIRYRDRLACVRPGQVRVPGCTTSGIASPP
jgi:integrase